MPTTKLQTHAVASKFALKQVEVDLIGGPAPSQAVAVSLVELEARRSARRPLTASRHGLEIICGSSCETGAQ